MTEENKTQGSGDLPRGHRILLYTHKAMAVFDGRKKTENKSEIFSVPRFLGSVNQIYEDAMADDPWADWWLVKIDDHIERTKMKLNKYQEEFRKLYPNSPSIKIRSAESTDPESRWLNFPTSSYVNRIVNLLIDYDQFCREVLGGIQEGALARGKARSNAERFMYSGTKVLRSVLLSGTGYRRQGVTRNDVLTNNPKALKAAQLMGPIPGEILNMKRRSALDPQYKLSLQDELIKSQQEAV